jgi:hypothetical protein
MTVKELIAHLQRYESNSRVFVRDGYHFMRKTELGFVEEEHNSEWSSPNKVILVGEEPKGHSV